MEGIIHVRRRMFKRIRDTNDQEICAGCAGQEDLDLCYELPLCIDNTPGFRKARIYIFKEVLDEE